MSLFSPNKDNKFSGLWGSLAARVMVVALCFLVVPLLVSGIISYIREYREDFKELYTQLKILGLGRTTVLNQFNQLEYQFLDMTDELLRLKASEPGVSPNEINYYLTKIAKEQNAKAIFVLTKDSGKWTCTNASLPYMLGKDYTPYVDQQTLSQEHAAMILYDPLAHRGYYVVTKRIFSPSTGRVEGILDITLSNQTVLERIALIKKNTDPTAVSLLNPEGMVYISTNPDLLFNQFLIVGEPSDGIETEVKPKQTIEVKPEKLAFGDLPDSFMFKFNGKRQNAVILPVEGSDLKLMVSVPSVKFLDHFLNHIAQVSITLLIVLIVGGIAAYWLTYKMARPFRSLCGVMASVEEGNLNARFEDQKMGFEINVVGEFFNNAVESLLKHMHLAENERVAKETLAKELDIGREVQKSILPKQVPAFSDLEIANGFIAAKEVGGDFYDLFVVQKEGQDYLMCSVADTAGKGISACFYSLGLRSMLRSYGATAAPLDQVLLQTNNVFCKDTGDTGVFVTAWVAYLDEKTKVLTFSSCGHPPALLKRKNGEVEKLTTPGIALGASYLDHIPTNHSQLEAGDVLLIYSDGITEAHNGQNELYGESRLMEYLKSHPCDHAQKVVDDLLADIGQFTTNVA
ncbi:MAG: PP2C family protein-serine/threonine phosphatase, partial [Chlamydiia bacterium]|nr:PP2C family protein-serine/threonine phosphatase [Chlamydiia bacterium]